MGIITFNFEPFFKEIKNYEDHCQFLELKCLGIYSIISYLFRSAVFLETTEGLERPMVLEYRNSCLPRKMDQT